MSLQFTTLEFKECPGCAAKSGSPALCKECLERRELIDAVVYARRVGSTVKLVVCKRCKGSPNPECPEHGR